MNMKHTNCCKGSVQIPGDKSISHRAIMLGSLAKGTTEITNFLRGADCLSTMDCFRKMGISIEDTGNTILVHGKGLHGLKAPSSILDVGNSGTTTRLISGILAGQRFSSMLNGDASIQQRPMKRILTPLQQMGAQIQSIKGNDCAPLAISPGSLSGIHYESPIASAQVKSSILFAGMYASGETAVTEPVLSRNHSELMLLQFGADLSVTGTTSRIQPEPSLLGQQICVPGDISSAAYFLAAGLIVPNSEIRVEHVGINPTRDGILQVIRQMGGEMTLENMDTSSAEITADILVRTSNLNGITIGGDLIPTLIDELPMIAVMACFAKGTTVIKDAAELKVKESNRIDTVVSNLKAMGACIEATEDGMIIHGGCPLHGATIHSYGDHRIAMSFAVAALAADGVTTITNGDCVNISYPDFYQTLFGLCQC